MEQEMELREILQHSLNYRQRYRTLRRVMGRCLDYNQFQPLKAPRVPISPSRVMCQSDTHHSCVVTCIVLIYTKTMGVH